MGLLSDRQTWGAIMAPFFLEGLILWYRVFESISINLPLKWAYRPIFMFLSPFLPILLGFNGFQIFQKSLLDIRKIIGSLLANHSYFLNLDFNFLETWPKYVNGIIMKICKNTYQYFDVKKNYSRSNNRGHNAPPCEVG